MPSDPANRMIDNLYRCTRPGDGVGQTDGELLTRFVERHDDTALAALVRRHAGMVWGVCIRALRNPQDAEDSFQAAFLVLVRKASSVAPREMVGNWLYGVANQVAAHAKRGIARRRAREVQVADIPDTPAPQPGLAPDLQLVLDEELIRLPDIYRAVVVLCDLEGRTRKEVARRLGVPEGTVGGRLARARALLAKRLDRRGILFSGSSVAAALSAVAESASAPPGLVASTVKATSLLATGRAAGVASAKVAALTEGVVRTMFVSKIKAALCVVPILALVTTGVTFLTDHTAPAQEHKKPPVEKGAGRTPPRAKNEAEAFTAWGKAIGGLQAGLGFRPGEKRAYATGETVRLSVRVRNVGTGTAEFQYLSSFFIETEPSVTNGDGKLVLPGRGFFAASGRYDPPHKVALAPGKEIELHELKIDLKPAGRRVDPRYGYTTVAGVGKFTVRYERILGNSTLGVIAIDPVLSKLGTGNLELEVEKPAAAERPTASGPEWMRKFAASYQLKTGEYVKRVPAPFIPERRDFVRPRFPDATAAGLDESLAAGVLFVDDDGKGLSYRAIVSTAVADPARPAEPVRPRRLPLHTLITQVTGLLPPEVMFDNRTEEQEVVADSDFVVRTGAPLDKLVSDLRQVIRLCKLVGPNKAPMLVLGEQAQDVYVVTGTFKVTPRKGRNAGEVDVYADGAVLNEDSTGKRSEPTATVGTGESTVTPQQFVRQLGAFLDRRMVWEAETSPGTAVRTYTHARRGAGSTADEQAADREPEKVLKNVAGQTGLTFRKETRKVQVLRVFIAVLR